MALFVKILLANSSKSVGPVSLLEISARHVILNKTTYSKEDIPGKLKEYLDSYTVMLRRKRGLLPRLHLPWDDKVTKENDVFDIEGKNILFWNFLYLFFYFQVFPSMGLGGGGVGVRSRWLRLTPGRILKEKPSEKRMESQAVLVNQIPQNNGCRTWWIYKDWTTWWRWSQWNR